MRKPQRVKLSPENRAELERWSKERTLPARQRLRARVLLMADEGKDDTAIAAKLCASRQRCGRIRARFLAEGLQALVKDRPRPGRPRQIDPQRILNLTRDESPDTAFDWSQNLLAKKAGVSASSVRRIWKTAKIKLRFAPPKVSDEPRFAVTLEAVVGLYLAPPIRALVLRKGKNSGTEALTRIPSPQALRRTPTLFATLNTLDHTLLNTGLAGPDYGELTRFLEQIDPQIPADQELYLFLGCDRTLGRRLMTTWLKSNPRPTVKYRITPACWLDMVKRFFRNLTTRPLRQGMIQSMAQLQTDITAHLATPKATPKAAPKPFSWTANVADIRAKAVHDNLQT